MRTGWHRARTELAVGADDDIDTDVPEPSGPTWDGVADSVIDRCQATGTTALLVHADAAATALAQRCELRGIVVPRSLSIIAYDDEVAELYTPRLTAVRPPRQSIGRAALDLIAARLRDPDRPRHRIVISPTLRVRDTTALEHSTPSRSVLTLTLDSRSISTFDPPIGRLLETPCCSATGSEPSPMLGSDTSP